VARVGVGVMYDLGAIRKALGEQLNAALPAVNVYAYPEPQPEYPAVVLGELDGITYHVAHCREGIALEWLVDVLVANPDQESATRNLEALLSGDVTNVAVVLEATTPPNDEWSNLVVTEARNFRRLESLDGFGCELVVLVHV
jgi:hypothetical protein